MKAKTINTTWELATYDVWGNARDGYDVNDVFRHSGKYDLRLKVETCNVGTPRQFDCAYPSDYQIRNILGIGKTQIETEGDDTHIYVNRSRDGYPLGELSCLSHDSLSPIRANEQSTK